MSVDVPTGPVCTALGCTDEAAAIIELPDGRRRAVCPDHTDDGEVVDDV